MTWHSPSKLSSSHAQRAKKVYYKTDWNQLSKTLKQFTVNHAGALGSMPRHGKFWNYLPVEGSAVHRPSHWTCNIWYNTINAYTYIKHTVYLHAHTPRTFTHELFWHDSEWELDPGVAGHRACLSACHVEKSNTYSYSRVIPSRPPLIFKLSNIYNLNMPGHVSFYNTVCTIAAIKRR